MWPRIIKFLFVLICVGFGQRLNAQTWLLTVMHNQTVTVSNTITYNIGIVNQSSLILNPVFVTNMFPTSLRFVGATSNATVVAVAPGRVTFTISSNINPGQTFPLTLQLRATQAGTVTNRVTANTAAAFSNLVLEAVTVVSPAMARSDVAVSIEGLPTSPIFAGDWVPYTINVQREGPDPVSGVAISTTVPSGADLVGYSPSNAATVNGRQLTFNLGTVSLMSTQVQVMIQPNVAATNVPISARLTTPAGAEINTNNNTATNLIAVLEGLPGQVNAEVISAQFFNPQNALFEQLIRVSNVGTSSVPSARVILSNFNFKVVNAVGTNNGFPFVVHAGGLQTNESTDLVLEYFFPDRTEHEDPELVSYPVGTINLTPPAGGTNIAITNIIILPPNDVVPDSERVLLQFPANPGATYVITYSSNLTFSGAVKAQPPLVAQANYVNWIDYGPPKTISRPSFGEFFTTNTVVTTNMMETNMFITNIVIMTNMSMRLYQAIQVSPPQ